MRKKKTPHRRLKEKCEKLSKQIVKRRDGNSCQWCGRVVESSNMHASHIIPVSADGRLAFDPLNMKVLCFHCHINRWHKNALEAAEWFNKKYPNRLEILRIKQSDNKKKGTIKLEELRETKEALEEQLESM